jgi:hypothetical protein
MKKNGSGKFCDVHSIKPMLERKIPAGNANSGHEPTVPLRVHAVWRGDRSDFVPREGPIRELLQFFADVAISIEKKS